MVVTKPAPVVFVASLPRGADEVLFLSCHGRPQSLQFPDGFAMTFSYGKARSLRSVSLAVLLLSFVVLATDLLAQNPNGALRGEVQDATGARVAGAHISVQSLGSSITRKATADSQGAFRI